MSFRELNFESMGPVYAPPTPDLDIIADVQSMRREDVAVIQSGLAANSLVETMRGPVNARDLRAGDMVKTRDHGFQCLRWVGLTRRAKQDAMPVRSPIGTLMSEQHLVLLRHPKALLYFGVEEVLCAAGTLAEIGHYIREPEAVPTYVHLLFDFHELISCNGDWVESLQPDVPRLRLGAPDMAAEIAQVLPRLASVQGMASYVQERPIIDQREALALFS